LLELGVRLSEHELESVLPSTNAHTLRLRTLKLTHARMPAQVLRAFDKRRDGTAGANTHKHTLTHSHTRVRARAPTNTIASARTHAHARAHARTHTHTHTHTPHAHTRHGGPARAIRCAHEAADFAVLARVPGGHRVPSERSSSIRDSKLLVFSFLYIYLTIDR
jgi:hypothetical protein